MIPLYIIVAVTIGVLVLVAVILVNRKNPQVKFSSQCNLDSDCNPNEKCSFIQEDKQKRCIARNQKECGVYPFTELEKCRINTKDCQKCINTPNFSCQRISWGKPKILDPGSNYTVGLTDASTSDSLSLKINITEVGKKGEILSLSVINPAVRLKSGTILSVTPPQKVQTSQALATIKLTEDINFYKYQLGPKVVVDVPESEDTGYGWCLPNFNPADNQICNTFTSDYALFQNIDGSYYWACVCKHPEFMNHRNTTGIFDSCTKNLGCNNLYTPTPDPDSGLVKKCKNNTECSTDEKCCSLSTEDGKCLSDGEKTQSNVYYCMTKWSENSLDDPLLGSCVCDSKTYPIYSNDTLIFKTCVEDSCAVGGGKYDASKKSCTCPTGYVSCDIVGSTATIQDNRCTINVQQGVENNGICIPNPCAPGTVDTNGGCNCPVGYKRTSDSNAIGGVVCKDACNPNPCEYRGECKFEDSTQTVSCVNCKCPFCNPSSDTDLNCKLPEGMKNDNLCSGDNGKTNGSCDFNSQCCSNDCKHIPFVLQGYCA